MLKRLLNAIQHFRDYFAMCKGCEARDVTIALLKEELHRRDAHISEVEMRNDNLNLDIRNRLDYVTGMNRIPAQPAGTLHSVPRNTGIQGKIARAEASERDSALSERRKKEYEQRIAELRPETEVMKDAVGPSNAQVENG